jgi:hypothetical protein
LSGIEGMQVTINGNDFEKNIQIETSEDNSTWKPLATCSVFDYSSRINLRNTKLNIPPTTARYIRLTISGDKPATGNTSNANDENVVLKYKDLEFRSSLPTNPTTTAKPPRLVTGVNAWYGKTIKERQVTDSAPLAISGSSTSEKGDTILDLGESNLPLTAITLDIGTKYFMRQVRVESSTGKKDALWYEIANDSIYRFPAANRETSGRPNADTAIRLDGRQYARLRLIIVNRDNTPLTVNSISGSYLQRNLYLLPEKSRHYAVFCDSSDVTFPRYDLPSILPENSPELTKAVAWNLSEPQPNSAFDNRNTKPVVSDNNGVTPAQLWLFRGLILLLAVGLAFWAWSTLRKLK